ncbi:hypothetical protein EDD18DRAFT_1106953 [Armillaria luteobubalina]|uniref:GST N-terminal domain-containing protein n=1 Tax=Armillaria luteobubalina TaxID=153913 RepID=A0AA39Q2Z2_9AGAR|nr:hypothetical protein EDD18DRAFT_1106953 [Armillaria luteobubalina]
MAAKTPVGLWILKESARDGDGQELGQDLVDGKGGGWAIQDPADKMVMQMDINRKSRFALFPQHQEPEIPSRLRRTSRRRGSSNTYRSSSYSGDKSPFYTMPIIQNPSAGDVVSESAAITEYFDKTYPASRVTLLISAGTKAPPLVFRKAVAESLFQRAPSSGMERY